MYAEKLQMIIWHPPEPGWHKLNTDGASKNNPGLAGAGGIIRDSHSNFVKAYSSFLSIQTSLFAEVKAVHEGIILALSLGISKLYIELDSKVVVDILIKGNSCPWDIWYLILDIKKKLPLFDSFVVS